MATERSRLFAEVADETERILTRWREVYHAHDRGELTDAEVEQLEDQLADELNANSDRIEQLFPKARA
jgi:selenocysteine lyase/cysteine desulfurase